MKWMPFMCVTRLQTEILKISHFTDESVVLPVVGRGTPGIFGNKKWMHSLPFSILIIHRWNGTFYLNIEELQRGSTSNCKTITETIWFHCPSQTPTLFFTEKYLNLSYRAGPSLLIFHPSGWKCPCRIWWLWSRWHFGSRRNLHACQLSCIQLLEDKKIYIYSCNTPIKRSCKCIFFFLVFLLLKDLFQLLFVASLPAICKKRKNKGRLENSQTLISFIFIWLLLIFLDIFFPSS